MFRRPKINPALFEQAIEHLRASRRTIVLTGAGLSTSSGIPDFRSNSSSLWSQVNPFEVASIWGFRDKPQRFYKWIQPLATTILNAQPNPAHLALAEMERKGFLHLLVTQNIDALHQRAGSQNIIEMHGHLRTISCIDCDYQTPAEPYYPQITQQGTVPRCPRCGGALKPDVVLFGEPLIEADILRAQEAALQSDLILVAGSSLEVLPVADLPALAVRSGSHLIIVNLGMTPYDHLADVCLHGDVVRILPRLVAAL
ncbi:MAG: NAD-dependent protein deacylase [Chloroflexi bacterium]|nr:NAD-dependent protein deacylase [Chloroflexota bacterium]